MRLFGMQWAFFLRPKVFLGTLKAHLDTEASGRFLDIEKVLYQIVLDFFVSQRKKIKQLMNKLFLAM